MQHSNYSGFLEISLHAIRATISEKIANNLEQFEITEEQRQIFYEEESSTTNALKAVLGYEPKDEKRICKHYDPKTGRCFKGNSCPYEHVKLMEGKYSLKPHFSFDGFLICFPSLEISPKFTIPNNFIFRWLDA